MEINGKSIRGMFVYDPSVEFERGDFIIHGDVIYIAKRNVTGISPTEDIHGDYYKTYLLDAIATEEDFKEYAAGLGDDKFVSMRSLGNILGSYMAGFNEKGLICNTVTAEGIELRNIFDTILNVPDSEKYFDVLDRVMASPELNNCTFVVSRDVANHVLEVGSLDSTEIESVLLRQYTYEDKTAGCNIRIQELVDYENGLLKYRYCKSNGGYDPTNVSWQHITANESTSEYISRLESYYKSEIYKLKNMGATLKGMFRFFSIDYTDGGNGKYSITKDALNESKLLSISFSRGGLYYDFKTVNISDVYNYSIPLRLYVMDNPSTEVLIDVTICSGNEKIINITTGSDIKIIDIYGRREYNQEYDLDEDTKQLFEDIS